MARVFELASETSRIFEQYDAIHDEVFGLSMRRLLGAVSETRHLDDAKRAQRLQMLASQIRDIQRAIGELEDSELTKRSKNLVRSALLDYAFALEESITRLLSICSSLHLEFEGRDGYAGYRENGFRSDTISYDDSIQAHKRLGAQLTDLFAKI